MSQKYTSVHNLEGRVPLKQAIPLGMQHVLAMFVGNITPLMIVSGALGMDTAMRTILIQNAMLIAGIATLIQLYPIWKVGSGLPVVMGTSSGFIGQSTASAAAGYGYGAILGATLIGSIIEIIIGFFIKPIRKIFPPVVTGIVVLTIGITLMPIGINYFGGGSGAADYGSPQNLFLGFLVMILVLFFNQFFKGVISASSILIAITIGYITAICMGVVDLSGISNASWFSIPTFMPYALEFEVNVIIPMAIVFIATAVETIGDTSGVAVGGLGREATDDELAGSVILDGVASAGASFFGVLPNTSFSQNVGLVAMTKVVNRFAIMTGAVFLILCGFIPKLGAIISSMPNSVLGGATVIMFAMIAVSGMQLLFSKEMDQRNGIIVAVSLGLALGVSAINPANINPDYAFAKFLFGQDSVVTSFVVAVILNLVLPQTKKD